MREVTDPKLLAELNGDNSFGSLRPVTDPNILQELNEKSSNFNPSFGEKLAPNILVGLANLGHGILNSPSNFAKYLSSKNLISSENANKVPRQEDYDYADLLNLPTATLSDKVTRGLVQNLPAFLAPELSLGKAGKALNSIPLAGRFLKKTIGNAIPVSAFEATQSENPIESGLKAGEATVPFSALSTLATTMNPLARLAGRVGLGAAGAYGGYEGAKALGAGSLAEYPAAAIGGLLGIAGKNPKLEAKESMLSGVEGTPYQEKLRAASRLGLDYLTPAEASGNPFVAAQQGAHGKTPEGSRILYEKGHKRLESERNAIGELFDTIYKKEKLDPEVSSLYKSAHEKSVPQEFVDSLKENEIYKSAVKNMENKPAYREKLKDVPENSIGYLDHVKQSLDDMIESAPKKEGRILKQTRNELVNKMDEISPEYKQARSLAERGIVRNKLEEALNEKEIKGTTFFNKVLKNDKNFKKTRYSLRNIPEAQQKLDDIRLIFGDLINPPTVRTAAGFTKAGMNQNRNSRLDLNALIKEKLSGNRYDKAAIELITNPKWEEELHKVSKIGNIRNKAGKFIDLLGRASVARASQDENANSEGIEGNGS